MDRAARRRRIARAALGGPIRILILGPGLDYREAYKKRHDLAQFLINGGYYNTGTLELWYPEPPLEILRTLKQEIAECELTIVLDEGPTSLAECAYLVEYVPFLDTAAVLIPERFDPRSKRRSVSKEVFDYIDTRYFYKDADFQSCSLRDECLRLARNRTRYWELRLNEAIDHF